MTQSAAALPSFDRPPVAEVMLDVQLEPIGGLRAAHLGLLSERLNEGGREYPVLEEYLPFEPVIEQFEPQPSRPPFEVKVIDNPPVPRVFMSNQARTSILQVQADRFMYSWSRADPSAQYPRYPKLRDEFTDLYTAYFSFLEDRAIGQMRVRQVSLAYLNILPAGEGWTSPAQIERVVQMWHQGEAELLPEVEDVRFLQRHLLKDEEGAYGRLYVGMEPTETPEGKPGLRLLLTVRGRPRGEGLSGVGNFMDNAHEIIVRAFAAVTTKQMHELWGRVT
jgi:uncharacterized protein (TIGR04255 family)